MLLYLYLTQEQKIGTIKIQMEICAGKRGHVTHMITQIEAQILVQI